MKNRENPIKFPPVGDIILERPKDMSQQKFKEQRTYMNKKIHDRLKQGFLVYKAAEIYETNLGEKKEDGEPIKVKLHRTFPPFRGIVKKLNPI